MEAVRTRRHVIVHGQVQGVYFRGSTVERARQLGVAGWVRNRSDGAVEAVFEGAPEAVSDAVRFCHEGPSWARVERIEQWEEAPEGLTRFEVR